MPYVGDLAKVGKVGAKFEELKELKELGEPFLRVAEKSGIHKNSLKYVGETHVYRILGPDGKIYKIGESAQGVMRNGLSTRGERQARMLSRESGLSFRSEIRRTFPDKASAREYERRTIERFRGIYGPKTLPGNKTNR